MSVMQSAIENLDQWPTLPDLPAAARELVETKRALDAYRHRAGYRDIDPQGDALEAALDEARRLFRSACLLHGIDRDILVQAIF